jgi:hypothetical protein
VACGGDIRGGVGGAGGVVCCAARDARESAGDRGDDDGGDAVTFVGEERWALGPTATRVDSAKMHFETADKRRGTRMNRFVFVFTYPRLSAFICGSLSL